MCQKIRRLILDVVVVKVCRTTTSISMPNELSSVEDAIKLFAVIAVLKF
jgi:hypothetical protein